MKTLYSASIIKALAHTAGSDVEPFNETKFFPQKKIG